jgi:hypothetical protein
MGAERSVRRDEMTLFEPAEALDGGPIVTGRTTLDRLHQALLLFVRRRAGLNRPARVQYSSFPYACATASRYHKQHSDLGVNSRGTSIRDTDA